MIKSCLKLKLRAEKNIFTAVQAFNSVSFKTGQKFYVLFWGFLKQS